MSHRVIAGIAKGRKLKLVPGNSTRPVMDRVKEALFSILGRDVLGSRFLDMFAGTGSIGIEALSRGAHHATFLDLEKMAIQTIYDNLKVTNLTDKATVRRTDALAYLRQSVPDPLFDFIYIAPPQYKGMWLTALKVLDANPAWLTPDVSVIVQIDPKERETVTFNNLIEYDQRTYGRTLLWFFQGKPAETSDGQQTEG